MTEVDIGEMAQGPGNPQRYQAWLCYGNPAHGPSSLLVLGRCLATGRVPVTAEAWLAQAHPQDVLGAKQCATLLRLNCRSSLNGTPLSREPRPHPRSPAKVRMERVASFPNLHRVAPWFHPVFCGTPVGYRNPNSTATWPGTKTVSTCMKLSQLHPPHAGQICPL